MKKIDLITAVVLAVLGLGIIAYGVLDAVYFGIETLSLICLIGGTAAVTLAAVLVFIKDEPRERAAAPMRETVPAQTPSLIAERTGRPVVTRSGFVLAAAILSSLCAVFAMLFARGLFPTYDGSGSVFVTLVFGSAYMQVVWGTVASVCLFFGYFKSLKWAVLVGSICECLAAISFILWLMAYVLPIVFGFVGYAKMRKVSDFDTGGAP